MCLFKDRNLSIAILISILGHFVFMFSIRPVFPAGRIIKHNTSIAFLGDILESMGSYARKNLEDQEKFARNLPLKQIFFDNKIGKLEPIGSGFISISPEKKEFLYPLNDASHLKLNIQHKKEISRGNFSYFFIKGDARDRLIVYKPDLGKVTVLPSDFNSDFSANIRFKISKEGFVQYAECDTSSGFPEIDQAAVRYVRKWQFVPVAEDGQEGVVRVSFK